MTKIMHYSDRPYIITLYRYAVINCQSNELLTTFRTQAMAQEYVGMLKKTNPARVDIVYLDGVNHVKLIIEGHAKPQTQDPPIPVPSE